MEYLYILKQALVYALTAYWCYQTVISLCALVKLKEILASKASKEEKLKTITVQ